jgi:hypothetical protein
VGTFQQLGEPGGNVEVFTVDGVDITITITKDGTGQDQSISFSASGGFVHDVLVKPGNFRFHYNYDGFGPIDPDTGLPSNKVQSDGSLNEREGGRSQEVSHIDWCLSPGEPFTSTILECTSPEGCNPSGRQLNQYAGVIGTFNDGQFADETVTQKPVPARFEYQSHICGLDEFDNVINPYIAHDPRVNDFGNLHVDSNGDPIAIEQDLTQVFDFTGFDDIPNGVMAPPELVGRPCLAALKGTVSKDFEDFYLAKVPLDDWTFIVTQDHADVDDLNSLIQPGPVGAIDPETGEVNRDLSWIEQVVLQPDDRKLANYPEQHAGAFTFFVTNPGGTKSGKGTVYFLGMSEACVSLGAAPNLMTPTTDAVAYLEAVQDCKVQLALEYLDNMETALFAAQDSGAMIEPINFYLVPLNKVRNMFFNRNFKKAINDSDQFCDRVIGTNWVVLEQNDPGNLSMRCSNMSWRAQELLDAEGIIEAMIDAL